MKNQYFGDINDYLKYGLLRQFAQSGSSVAVCWMLTPDDGGRDGRRISYLAHPGRFRSFDPELFDLLSECVAGGRRTIAEAEARFLVPGAVYFDDVLTDDRASRDRYFSRLLAQLPAETILFFDPDNGLEVKSVRRGRRASSKFLYLEELGKAFQEGHSLVLYQHFPRVRRSIYLDAQAERIRSVAALACITAVSTPSVAFIVVAQPERSNRLRAVADVAVAKWTQTVVASGGPSCSVMHLRPTAQAISM